MKPLKLVNSPSNLVPLLPKNQLAPSRNYDTILDDWLARSRSPHTKRMYSSNIRAFFQSLGHELTTDILTQFLTLDGYQAFELVSRYRSLLVSQKLSPSTVNQKTASIKSLVNYASCVGKCFYTLNNIKAEKLTQYRDTKGIPKEQFKLMLEAVDATTIKGIRDRAILLLLWGNALRRSELVNCDIKHYLRSTKELAIIGKGKAQRETVSLGPGAIASIDAWLDARGSYSNDDPLFSATHQGYWGNRLHTHSIYKLVQKYADLAGIDKVMSPHRIRHSSITAALDLTDGDVRRVQKLSRHSNINTLMIYDDNRQNLQGEVTSMLDDLF